jgi:alkaline phosphatase
VVSLPLGPAGVQTPPLRDDCLNMEVVLLERGYELCYTKDEIMELTGEWVWCSYAERAMEAEINRESFAPDEPSLAEMSANVCHRVRRVVKMGSSS